MVGDQTELGGKSVAKLSVGTPRQQDKCWLTNECVLQLVLSRCSWTFSLTHLTSDLLVFSFWTVILTFNWSAIEIGRNERLAKQNISKKCLSKCEGGTKMAWWKTGIRTMKKGSQKIKKWWGGQEWDLSQKEQITNNNETLNWCVWCGGALQIIKTSRSN